MITHENACNYEGKDTEQSNPEADELNHETEGGFGKGICEAEQLEFVWSLLRTTASIGCRWIPDLLLAAGSYSKSQQT